MRNRNDLGYLFLLFLTFCISNIWLASSFWCDSGRSDTEGDLSSFPPCIYDDRPAINSLLTWKIIVLLQILHAISIVLAFYTDKYHLHDTTVDGYANTLRAKAYFISGLSHRWGWWDKWLASPISYNHHFAAGSNLKWILSVCLQSIRRWDKLLPKKVVSKWELFFIANTCQSISENQLQNRNRGVAFIFSGWKFYRALSTNGPPLWKKDSQ